MTNSLFKALFLISLLIIIGCSSTKFNSLKNEDIVRSYINARNNHDFEKVNTLVEENYHETFMDESIELEHKEHLADRISWEKELDSHIELLNIKSDGNNVVTIEKFTNYLDVALRRKPRKFRIVYTFNNHKIQHQKIDTVMGHHKVAIFNSDKYTEFEKYCAQNNLTCSGSLNQEFGIQLRKGLEKYKKEKH